VASCMGRLTLERVDRRQTQFGNGDGLRGSPDVPEADWFGPSAARTDPTMAGLGLLCLLIHYLLNGPDQRSSGNAQQSS
jgi:hypothetical protein